MRCILRKPVTEGSVLDVANNTQTGPLPRQAGNRVRRPFFLALFDTALQVLACAIKQGSKVKGAQTGKEETQLPVYRQDDGQHGGPKEPEPLSLPPHVLLPQHRLSSRLSTEAPFSSFNLLLHLC